jgi:hypothetical protein
MLEMKPYRQKTGTKQKRKRRRKQRAIKNQIKMRKNNKTLSQKVKKGRIFFSQKAIKGRN